MLVSRCDVLGIVNSLGVYTTCTLSHQTSAFSPHFIHILITSSGIQPQIWPFSRAVRLLNDKLVYYVNCRRSALYKG